MHPTFACVALTHGIEAQDLRRGDIGTVVHVHELGGYEVEFVTACGRPHAVLTLSDRDIRALGGDDLLFARRPGDAISQVSL